MKIKKLLAVVLSSFVLTSLLAGCGNTAGTPSNAPSGSDAATLKVGAGSGEIVFPEEMFPMSEGFATVHDTPHARVMVFENGEKVAIVSMELVNCPTDCIDIIKQVVNEKTGTPVENIWVHSTHIFCTPHAPDEAEDRAMFNEAVTNAITDAAQQAADTFQEAVIGVATGESDVTASRDVETADGWAWGLNGDGPSDPTLTVLKAESLSGETIGLLFAYGTRSNCGDVTRGTTGREITTDLTGYATTMMEEEFGAPVLFCMTASADQSPKEAAVDIELDADGHATDIDLGVQAGLEIAEKMGAILGNDAIAIAKTISCTEAAAVAHTTGSFEWAAKEGDGELEIAVEAIRIGDTAFVGVKPEVNCATSLELKEASPFANTLLMAFVNGDQKYMPDADAYDKGTSEASSSGLAQGAAEQMVETATELLESLK